MSPDAPRKTLTINGRRTPFSGAWRLNVKCVSPLTAAPGVVLERFLTSSALSILPDELLTTVGAQPQLRNIRGVPIEDESSERLFRCDGMILLAGETPEQSEHHEPFFYQIGTRFERFAGSDIVYSVEHAVSPILGTIASSITPAFVGRLVPARIDSAFFGFDTFVPRIFGALFGSAPVVSQKIRLILSRSHFNLEIDGTFPRTELIMKLDEHGVIAAYDGALGTLPVLMLLRRQLSENLANRIAFSEALD